MKNLALIIICALTLAVAPAKCHAQSYRSMFGAAYTEWIILAEEIPTGPIAAPEPLGQDILLAVEKDTTLQNIAYKKVSLVDTNVQAYANYLRHFLLREDTVSGKVWYKEYEQNGCGYYDTSEKLLYDFSLQVGDTFNISTPLSSNTFTIADKTVDSVYLDNDNRKHIRFAGSYWTFTANLPFDVKQVEFIEGVGCTMGIFYKTNCNKVPQPDLICAWKDGIKQYNNPTFNNSCDPVGNLHLSVPTSITAKNIRIYPNPAGEKLNIVLNGNTNNTFRYSIINSIGQTVLYGDALSNTRIINIAALPPGLYQLILNVDGQRVIRSFCRL